MVLSSFRFVARLLLLILLSGWLPPAAIVAPLAATPDAPAPPAGGALSDPPPPPASAPVSLSAPTNPAPGLALHLAVAPDPIAIGETATPTTTATPSATSTPAPSAPPSYDETYAYDSLGNLTTKAGTSYGYASGGGARPHAVANVGGEAYAYDANGNLLSGGGRTYTWTPDNLPSNVTSGGVTESYVYDAAANESQ